MEEWSCAEITKINAFKSETDSVSKAKPEVVMFGARRQQLILKHAFSKSSIRQWKYDDDYDVLADGAIVGSIMKAAASPVVRRGCGRSRLGIMTTVPPTHGYEPTPEAAPTPRPPTQGSKNQLSTMLKAGVVRSSRE
jgi:hypothetical protein